MRKMFSEKQIKNLGLEATQESLEADDSPLYIGIVAQVNEGISEGDIQAGPQKILIKSYTSDGTSNSIPYLSTDWIDKDTLLSYINQGYLFLVIWELTENYTGRENFASGFIAIQWGSGSGTPTERYVALSNIYQYSGTNKTFPTGTKATLYAIKF